METTLYKVTFKDGREYRVFCANKAQKNRFNKIVSVVEEDCEIQEMVNGIHNINQWERIVASDRDVICADRSCENLAHKHSWQRANS
jgi:hypothetical protein